MEPADHSTGDRTVAHARGGKASVAVTDPWGKQRVGFTAVTDIDRREWGLRGNQALETGGVLVANRVTIEIEAQAVQLEQAEPQTAAAVASQSSVQGGADRRALDN